jgi:hypothetical protein
MNPNAPDVLGKPMKLHRITDPKSIDERLLSQALANGASTLVLQFSKESAYDTSILEDVNRACRSFGSRINVRFWGHYGGRFDCEHLRHLPDVRSLNLDCLTQISNADELSHLQKLQEFAFGVFDSDLPDLLRTESLLGLRKLILAPSRKNNIDLAPLASYRHLEDLSLCAQASKIESIAHRDSVKRLFLSSIGRRQSLSFVRTMKGLLSLSTMLGGRQDLKELAHEGIIHLEVLRVRGISEIDLALFPNIEKLRIEDQMHLGTLNVSSSPHLRWLSIWNCKTFRDLQGSDAAEQLGYLFVGKTAIEPEDVLRRLPSGLKRLSLTGYGKRRTDELRSRIESMGYAPAVYMEDDRSVT